MPNPAIGKLAEAERKRGGVLVAVICCYLTDRRYFLFVATQLHMPMQMAFAATQLHMPFNPAAHANANGMCSWGFGPKGEYRLKNRLQRQAYWCHREWLGLTQKNTHERFSCRERSQTVESAPTRITSLPREATPRGAREATPRRGHTAPPREATPRGARAVAFSRVVVPLGGGPKCTAWR